MTRRTGRIGEPHEYVQFDVRPGVAVITQKSGGLWPVWLQRGQGFDLQDTKPNREAGEGLARQIAEALT